MALPATPSERHVALRPKRRGWFIVSLSLAIASVGVYLAVWFWRGWSPGDGWGRTFGAFAAGLLLLEELYALRRRLRARPFKTAQNWLQVHVYGGILMGLFVLIHAGFRWPAGAFGWCLLGLSGVTTVSGLVGVFLQKTVPVRLTSGLGVEAIYERIPELTGRLRTEAEQMVGQASEPLRNLYESHVRAALARPVLSWSYLLDIRSNRDRLAATFDGLRPFLPDPDQERAARLRAMVLRKCELEAHYTLQTALRIWVLVHVPVAMLLTAFVIAHIAAVWRF